MDHYVPQGFGGDDQEEQYEEITNEEEIRIQMSTLREDLSEGEDGLCEPYESETLRCVL
jgi:hypothetical protein